MKNKLQIWTAMWFLLVGFASAVPVNYETTMVSRLVGENADDMRVQLMKDAYTLQDAGLYTEPSYETKSDLTSIMSSQFSGFTTTNPLQPSWSFLDVKNKLQNNKNNFLVLSSDVWTGTPYDTNAGSANDATKWNIQKSNLIVFDSYAAGMHTRGRQSFASIMSKKAAYVAPLSHTSANFVKAFACMLGKYPTIGEVFRQARNTYYVHTNQRSEFLGLTMLSYAMYGSPLVSFENPNWDTNQRRNLCVDYDKTLDIAEAGEFSIAEAEGVYTKEVSLDLGEPAVGAFEGFSTITTDKTLPKMARDRLVTPFRTEVTRFPLNTVISKVSLIGFEDAVDITVSDVPEWNGTEAQQRNCYLSTEQATIEFSYGQTEDSLIVIAQISPVDVINCATGELKFYKKAKYKIEYLPDSPILIKDVTHPDVLIPNQTGNVQIEVENTQTSPAQGLFVLSGPSGTVSVINTTVTQSNYQLELQAPQEEGRYRYRIDFIQGSESKTYAEFDVDVKVLEAELVVPEFAGSRADATLYITNNLATSLPVTIDDQLAKGSTGLANRTQTATLNPGLNTVMLSYTGLTKADTSYDVFVNIAYLEQNKLLSETIVTNNAPIILQGDVSFKEGEVLNITPTAIDYDEDPVTLSVNSPFPLDGSYTFNYEEAGTYDVTITATDGLLTAEKTIHIVVDNTNRAPILTVPEVLYGKENQTLVIQPQSLDPDNQNDVTNDDNTLNITYEWPFDENGTYTPNFEMSGNITTFVTVSDGELVDSKQVTLVVENTDRPPNLDNLTDVTVKEGDFVNLWLAGDIDNENSVIDDDNGLQLYFAGGPDGGPLNHYGKWQTDYQDSGVYNITVEATDGELQVGKLITLTVQNVNRPPQILAPDVVYASGSVDLSQYIYDPDNANEVTNDDNQLTITYGTPFDANGKWTPPQPDSAASTTITVSDGEFTVSKNIMVMVDVGVTTQTPPMPIQEEPISEEPEAHEAPEEEVTPPENPSVPRPIEPTVITGSDLFEYPYLFMKNEELDVTLVVGDMAPSVHVVSAVDINQGLIYITGQNGSVQLASAIANIGNIISVGGPCDNPITQQITGKTDCHYNLQPGEGIIELYNVNGKVQIIVAGYNNIDTRRAARVLAEWGRYQVHGTSVLVKGTTLSDITVTEEALPAPPKPQQSEGALPATPQATQQTAQPQSDTQSVQQNTTQQLLQQNQQSQAQGEKKAEPTDDLIVEITVKDEKLTGTNTLKVKPDKELKIKMNLENKAATGKDIDIKIDTADLDQDVDDSVALKSGTSEQMDYTLEIPRLTEKDEYPLDIFVTDEKQKREWNLLLKIDKLQHEINIRTASFNPEIVPCKEDNADLTIKLENTGRNDEEGKLLIDGGALGKAEVPFDLSEGEDRLFKQSYNNLAGGEYSVDVKAEYGSKTAEKKVSLTVKACTAETTTQAKVQQETQVTAVHSEKKVAAINFVKADDDARLMETLHIGVIVLAGIFAAVMFMAVFKILRE